MGRTWWIYIIIIYYCYCLRTFLKHWNYAHVQPYPHDLILRYFICQIHDVFPSLIYNMNIHSCLTQKLRDIWNSQIYIFRRAHPVVSHKIIVRSTQHQTQRLLTSLCEGCPLTWSVGYAAHTLTTCHGTYRNRLPIQINLSLKADSNLDVNPLMWAHHPQPEQNWNFSDHELPVSNTLPSSAQMTRDFYSVIKGVQIWFLLRVYLSSPHPTSKHACLKTTLYNTSVPRTSTG